MGDLSIALVLPLYTWLIIASTSCWVATTWFSIASTSFWAATTWFSIASTSFWVATLRLDIKHGTQTVPLKEDQPPLVGKPLCRTVWGLFLDGFK